jgi:hypothetical protein
MPARWCRTKATALSISIWDLTQDVEQLFKRAMLLCHEWILAGRLQENRRAARKRKIIRLRGAQASDRRYSSS